jgi:hypothetical protein
MELTFKLLPTFILTLFFINYDNDHVETTTIAGKWKATQIISGFF